MIGLDSDAAMSHHTSSTRSVKSRTIERGRVSNPLSTGRFRRALVLVVLFSAGASMAQGTRLLRQPAISEDSIAFIHGGALWIVPCEGGDARRLTTAVGEESNPTFSPDGSRIAFTGRYDGNDDVYLNSTSNGVYGDTTYGTVGNKSVYCTTSDNGVYGSTTNCN